MEAPGYDTGTSAPRGPTGQDREEIPVGQTHRYAETFCVGDRDKKQL